VGNTFGYAALAFYCLIGFPVSSSISAAAPFAAGAYLFTGIRNKGAFIAARNQYLYLSSVFTALFLYPWLWQASPPHAFSLSMMVSMVPIVALLYLGSYFHSRGEEAKASTAYESINLFILLSIAVPLLAGAYSAVFSLIVSGAFIVVIGGAVLTGYHRSLNYAPVSLAVAVLFSFLFFVIPSYVIIGFAFMLFGITGMALAIISYRKEKIWSNAVLFSWIVGTVISLALFSVNKQVLIYTAAVWAMTFTLGALYIQRPEQEDATAD
jgi:hypothetical protein